MRAIYCRAQRSTYDKASHGWFFWNWKDSSSEEWDWRTCQALANRPVLGVDGRSPLDVASLSEGLEIEEKQGCVFRARSPPSAPTTRQHGDAAMSPKETRRGSKEPAHQANELDSPVKTKWSSAGIASNSDASAVNSNVASFSSPIRWEYRDVDEGDATAEPLFQSNKKINKAELIVTDRGLTIELSIDPQTPPPKKRKLEIDTTFLDLGKGRVEGHQSNVEGGSSCSRLPSP